MTPYTVLDKLLGPYSFSKTSRETLNDRIEYYFHDHSFMPLFMQVSRLESTTLGFLIVRSMLATPGKLLEADAESLARNGWTRARYEAPRADGQSCHLNIGWRPC